jgi:hypothetical protein
MYVGIDYSVTSPAIVVIKSDGKVHAYAYGKKKQQGVHVAGDFTFTISPYPTNYRTYMDRYKILANETLISLYKAIISEGTDLCSKVRLEGYSYASTGKVFNLAENMAVLKYTLSISNIEYDIIAPTKVKKYATDKGNANKTIMYNSFVEKTGIVLKDVLNDGSRGDNVGSPVSDIVDAYFIAMSIKDGVEADPEQ